MKAEKVSKDQDVMKRGLLLGIGIGAPAGALVLLSIFVILTYLNLYQPFFIQQRSNIYQNRMLGNYSILPDTKLLDTEAKGFANSLYLKPDELKELYREVLSYQSFMSYMKIFLPVALLLGITLGGTLGHYFVRSNVFESQTIMKKELLDSQKQTKDDLVQHIKEKTDDSLEALGKAKISYEDSQSKIDKIQEDLTEKITTRNDIEMMNIYYALSYSFFLNKDFVHAIMYTKKCLDSIDHLLLSKIILESEIEDIKEQRWFVIGDLAYYCADSYTAKKNKDDAVEGLRMARLLPEHFDEVKKRNKIALIDSYISVISRVGPLTESDKATWKKIFKDYRNPIKEFLTDIKTGEREFASYKKFLESIDA